MSATAAGLSRPNFEFVPDDNGVYAVGLRVSNAVTSKGGRRLGAAYEIVDDCRHDLLAWLDLLRERAGPRIALVGHSLGAVKTIYALAHEDVPLQCAIAISPPRLRSPVAARLLRASKVRVFPGATVRPMMAAWAIVGPMKAA